METLFLTMDDRHKASLQQFLFSLDSNVIAGPKNYMRDLWRHVKSWVVLMFLLHVL